MLNNYSETDAATYAGELNTQFRKGLLSYLVLLIAKKSIYTSEILNELKRAEVAVAEGTIYPLLARLQKDGLLEYEWQESAQGPPRKYYKITEYGESVRENLAKNIKLLNQSIKTLERSKKDDKATK